MPGTHVINGAGFLDSVAALATASINGIDLGPHSQVVKVRFPSGEHPGFAQVKVPLAVLDDIAPSIAGVASSPLMNLKHGMVGKVLAQMNPASGSSDPTVSIFTGYVTDIDADIGDDCGLVTLSDARFLLEGIQIIGSFWQQPNTTDIVYRQGVKAHFNKDNAPNMIWGYSGGKKVPLFCDSYFGITDDVALNGTGIPSIETGSVSEAQYWTFATMMLYMQFATSSQVSMLVAKFPYYKTIPTSVTWIDSLASAFDDPASNIQERKATERVYHCHSLMAVISDICKMAGPFAPSITMNADGTSTLSVVRTRYAGQDNPASPSPSSSKGGSLTRPTSGAAASVLTQGGTVTSGRLRESSRATYSVVAVTGARAMIECRFVSSRTLQNPDSTATSSMWWGWTVAYSNLAKADLILDGKGNISGSESKAILNVLKKYPDLFATWFVNPKTDFQAGTTQAGFPVAQNARPPLPHLLTSYVKSGSADQFAKMNSRRPIPVETTSDDEPTPVWVAIQENDGLQIEPNGMISLKAFRDTSAGALAGATYKIVSSGSYGTAGYDITTFEPKRIRMNLALPCDHRITGSVKMSWDHTPDPNEDLPLANGEVDDGDRFDPTTFSRLLAVDTGTLYAYEERGGDLKSWPLPESLKDPNTNAAYPSTDTMAGMTLFGSATRVRDDSQQAGNHATRRIEQQGRLDRGGNPTSPHIVLTEVPGMMINDLGGFPIKSVIEAIELDFTKQTTERILV